MNSANYSVFRIYLRRTLFSICLFLSISGFSSCTTKQQNSCEILIPKILIKPVGEYSLDVLNAQYAHEKSAVHFRNDTVYYIALDNKNNTLYIYDVFHEILLNKMEISLDGPNPVKITDFYVHNLDSIFIYSGESFDLQIRTYKNTIIDEYNLRGDELFNEWYAADLLTDVKGWEARIKFDSIKKKILLPIVPNLENKKGLISTFLIYSILEREFDNIGTVLPKDIILEQNHPTKHLEWYDIISFNSDTIISSHSGSSFIVKGLVNKVYEEFCRSTKSVKIEDVGQNLSLEEKRKFIITDGAYIEGGYAPNTNKYVLTVRNHQPYKDLDGLVNNVYHASISILVFTNEFEVEKEIVLPKDLYNYKHIYPVGDKILALKENPNDTDNSEDILYFSLFDY